MNRFILIALVVAFTYFAPMSALAANDEIAVFVDGQRVQSHTPAMIVNSSTMLPFRTILNAIGISDDHIEWIPKTQSIMVKANNKFVYLIIGNTGAVINTNMITLDAAPVIVNNSTMVPVGLLRKLLGQK
ncbi:MAG: copper amine oxidase N-terminal domain-containing protein [Syntrophomonas sp.]|nr:copper amine oxidase N-terminal domain-containing protein [Syntrophomonas sp.]